MRNSRLLTLKQLFLRVVLRSERIRGSFQASRVLLPAEERWAIEPRPESDALFPFRHIGARAILSAEYLRRPPATSMRPYRPPDGKTASARRRHRCQTQGRH